VLIFLLCYLFRIRPLITYLSIKFLFLRVFFTKKITRDNWVAWVSPVSNPFNTVCSLLKVRDSEGNTRLFSPNCNVLTVNDISVLSETQLSKARCSCRTTFLKINCKLSSSELSTKCTFAALANLRRINHLIIIIILFIIIIITIIITIDMRYCLVLMLQFVFFQ